MRLLLDTHAFIWAIAEPGKLPLMARTSIKNPDNEVFVSAVSFWEIGIKVRIKKLEPIGANGEEDLVALSESTGIQPISLTPHEAGTYHKLSEPIHSDTFDRMLIWQAITRKMTLVSGDSEFKKFAPHGLKLLWK